MTTYYVSITGLQLKSMLHYPRFGYFALNVMSQAKQAEGNVSADGNYVNGVHHTLSVWKDRKSMSRFMASGAHAQAMKINDKIGESTHVYGYETDTIPTWEEAIAIWREKKIAHGGSKKRKTPTALGGKSTRRGGGFWTTSTTAMLVLVAALVPIAALHLTESMQTLKLEDIE
jgi:hypothetical protein